jgi:uncharacterized protein (DUF488 family)
MLSANSNKTAEKHALFTIGHSSLDKKIPSRHHVQRGEPVHCHRRLLVGKVLSEKGIQIFHIRGDGRIQSEDEIAREKAGTIRRNDIQKKP